MQFPSIKYVHSAVQPSSCSVLVSCSEGPRPVPEVAGLLALLVPLGLPFLSLLFVGPHLLLSPTYLEVPACPLLDSHCLLRSLAPSIQEPCVSIL